MTRAPIEPQAWPAGPEAPPSPPLRTLLASVREIAITHRDTLAPLGVALAARLIVMVVATAILEWSVTHLHLNHTPARWPPASWVEAWNRKDALWYLVIA